MGVVQTTPRECLFPHTEQIVERFVPPLLEEENCVDVMHLTPQERENRTQEPIVGAPVRQITEDGVEQIAAVPVPQIKGDIVEVPPCRVPQVMEKIMKVTQSVPFERIQKRVGEQIAAVPVPQITEDILEVTQHVPLERVPNPIVEQIGGVPVPQDQQGASWK